MSKTFFDKMTKVFEEILTSETAQQKRERLMSNQSKVPVKKKS